MNFQKNSVEIQLRDLIIFHYSKKTTNKKLAEIFYISPTRVNQVIAKLHRKHTNTYCIHNSITRDNFFSNSLQRQTAILLLINSNQIAELLNQNAHSLNFQGLENHLINISNGVHNA